MSFGASRRCCDRASAVVLSAAFLCPSSKKNPRLLRRKGRMRSWFKGLRRMESRSGCEPAKSGKTVGNLEALVWPAEHPWMGTVTTSPPLACHFISRLPPSWSSADLAEHQGTVLVQKCPLRRQLRSQDFADLWLEECGKEKGRVTKETTAGNCADGTFPQVRSHPMEDRRCISFWFVFDFPFCEILSEQMNLMFPL